MFCDEKHQSYVIVGAVSSDVHTLAQRNQHRASIQLWCACVCLVYVEVYFILSEDVNKFCISRIIEKKHGNSITCLVPGIINYPLLRESCESLSSFILKFKIVSETFRWGFFCFVGFVGVFLK